MLTNKKLYKESQITNKNDIGKVAGKSTDSECLYLRSGVKVEPISCGWTSWTHLIPPVQHALNIAYRHSSLMQSFVKNSSVHMAALRDPNLFGGPFVDLDSGHVPIVKELLDKTYVAFKKYTDFAKSIRILEESIAKIAKGQNIEEAYMVVPDLLNGVVEIFYNIYGTPMIRIIEPIAYKKFDGLGEQILLSDIHDKDRRFFMNTPRFPGKDDLLCDIKFSAPAIDLLASARITPTNPRDLMAALNMDEHQFHVAMPFFTREAPLRLQPEFSRAEIRIRYMGHACVLLQFNGCSVLIDPVMAWNRDQQGGSLTFDDLPDKIDYVVVSHGHQDHFSIETLLQLRHRIGTVVVPRNNGTSLADPSLKFMLNYLGFRNVVTLDEFERVNTDFGSITSLPFPGEHGDLDIMTKQTILITMNNRTFLFLVDSNAVDPVLYKEISEIIGEIDTAFLGMECFGAPLSWLYGPIMHKPVSRRDDESRRLSSSNADRAWKMIEHLKPQRIYIYAMGFEPWLRNLMGREYSQDSIQLAEIAKFERICVANNLPINVLNGCYESILDNSR